MMTGSTSDKSRKPVRALRKKSSLHLEAEGGDRLFFSVAGRETTDHYLTRYITSIWLQDSRLQPQAGFCIIYLGRDENEETRKGIQSFLVNELRRKLGAAGIDTYFGVDTDTGRDDDVLFLDNNNQFRQALDVLGYRKKEIQTPLLRAFRKIQRQFRPTHPAL